MNDCRRTQGIPLPRQGEVHTDLRLHLHSPGPLLRGFYFPNFTPGYRTFDVLVHRLQGFLWLS